MVKRKILLNPGPAATTDSVKLSQIVPDICPREPEFSRVMEEISKSLVKIANPKNPNDYACTLFGGSGTTGMEVIISSVVPENKKILIINNGAYGERMTKIAKAHNIPLVEHFTEWGSLPDINELENELSKDTENQIAVVAMVHHETTTGILNSVKEFGEVAKKHGKIFIVDAISSFAGIPFGMEDYGIDFMVSTSNKCIQGMPGVCFVISRKDSLEKTRDIARRNFSLNLYDQHTNFEKNKQMRFTPPVQVLYALEQAIFELEDEGGVEARHKRYSENWETLNKGMLRLGFKIFNPRVPQSRILTTYLEPENPNYNFNEMHDKLYERGFTIYPGKLMPMEGQRGTFRLANMGAINKKDILNFLEALEEIMKGMNFLIKNDCIFCNLAKIKEDVLYETVNFMVKVGFGIAVPGHVMIIPKKHFDSFAEMSEELWQEYDELSQKLIRLITEKFSEPFFVEYTRDAQSVHHAHTHFMPLKCSSYTINNLLNEVIISSKIGFAEEDRKKLKKLYESGGSYVRIGTKDRVYFLDVSGIPNDEVLLKLDYRHFLKRKGLNIPIKWGEMTEEDKIGDETHRAETKRIFAENLDILK
jgi:2-aminoethylphosphonate aminotransferase